MVKNQELPLVFFKRVFCWSQLGHVLPIKFGFYHILSTSFRLVGILDGLSVGVRRSSPVSRHLYCPRMKILHVSPQGVSLVRCSRVVNLGRSDTLWYFILSPGARFPLLSSLVVVDGSGEVPRSGSEVGSLVYFSLGCIGSRVGSKNGYLLGESSWLSSFSPESSRCIRGYMNIFSLLDLMSSVSVTTVPGGWWFHLSLWCGVSTAAQACILSGSLKNSRILYETWSGHLGL